MTGAVKPEKYIVIDNGTGFRNFYDRSSLEVKPLDIVEFRPAKSVSAVWNWCLNQLSGDLLVANDDLILDPLAIEIFERYKREESDPAVVMYTNGGINAYSLFMVDPSIRDKTGLFDENFYPAYYEDCDHHYRMKLDGYKRVDIPGLNTRHVGSATLNEQKRLKIDRDHATYSKKNHEYYLSKWGGEPGHEKYRVPFNDPKFPSRYWPSC
jgi:hypothetical protein